MGNKKHGNTGLFSRHFASPFGTVILLWSLYDSCPEIFHILLSNSTVSAEQKCATLYPESTTASCPAIDKVTGEIQAYLHGGEIQFSLDLIRLNRCSQFQQNVLLAEYKIPRGSVSTYQRIALHLGKKKGSRAVGNALAHNPFPLIIPCHRAIRSDGFPGGYQGGVEMKQALLKMEGIPFDNTGRVITEEIFY